MFKFLKDKLKGAVEKFSKDVEEEVEEKVIPSSKTQVVEEEKEVKKETKKSPSKKEKTKTEIKKEIKEKEKTIESDKEQESETKEEIKSEDVTQIEEEPKQEEKKGFFKGLFKSKKVEETESIEEEIKKQVDEETITEKEKETIEKVKEKKTETVDETEKQEEKKGFFSKITDKVTKKKLSESRFDDLFWDIEIALLESNIAVEVIDKIKQDLKDALVDESHAMFKTETIIHNTLKKSISELLDFENVDFKDLIKEKKPYVIAFIGVNGSGKTTNLAKLAYKLKNDGFEVVIAACDTFRAAAIQQVEEHAKNVGVKLIKHDYGSDAAAVAFDAIEHAKSKGKDFVLIDTAGRNQANSNLMEELKKIIRVTKPDMKIFVGDSLTGNDAVEQAKEFNNAVGIDNIILSKVDADEKGGASVSISYVAKKPIIFIGNGQDYKDLENFNKDEFLEKLGLNE